MKLHRILSYSTMIAGAVAAARAVLKRWQWDETNIHAAVMLDWDDVQAVATRAPATDDGQERICVESLLGLYKEAGATHLSIPELTLNRLLERGELTVSQGSDTRRVYLRARNAAIADLVVTELRARLPHLHPKRSMAKNPLISFEGDLPTVAEVGLGFDPAQAALAQRAGLSPVARPIGYSWVRPEMIDRTLAQAAALGARIVAVQGSLIPGHEFEMQTTVEAMRRNRLTYAYFRESRHQKGDWFLAKNLAPDGLVVLAHEFEPPDLLEEDWLTISYRWANLAIEGGVRLCSVRFFRILHAADPLESLTYVRELANGLQKARFVLGYAGAVDLTAYHLQRDPAALACAGLSTAGAAGLAVDLLPMPNSVKLLGLGAATLTLTGLPFLEKSYAESARHRHHHHDHHHDGGNHHHHDHDHSHAHDQTSVTAYAPKGLALAASVAYPAAAVAVGGAGVMTALAHHLITSAAGAVALTATTAESDYVMGIEAYRGYNLDWLIPLGLAAGQGLVSAKNSKLGRWRWLPLVGVTLAALKAFFGVQTQDPLANFDREHRQAHTHHLSAFQRAVGDAKLLLSPKPLRKWALLAPLGLVGATLLQQDNKEELAAIASTTAVAGQVAALTGFRNGQRPLLKTVEGRAKGWGIGFAMTALLWFIVWVLNKRK